MKIKIIWGFIFCCLFLNAIPSTAATSPSSTTSIIPIEKLYKKIASLKIKNVQKLTGKKLSLKEKIGFLILKHKAKHPQNDSSKQGKTALTFGILALVLFVLGLFLPYVILGSLVASILAIVIGSSALKQNRDERNAYIGKLLGLIVLGVIALLLIVIIAFLASWGWA